TSAWANATETEVYAFSLLLVSLTLSSAERSALEDQEEESGRWLLLTAYLIALAPAVHLSALVGAPAAIALAARRHDGRWMVERVLLLGGVMIGSAGVGRMSWMLIGVGALVASTSQFVTLAEEQRKGIAPRTTLNSIGLALGRQQGGARRLAATMGLVALAASALLIMLVRARHDPAINQGNPNTLAGLADVVARRQYDVSPMWPRQAPIWLQIATLAQYVDWQFGFTLGHGIFTTPGRLLVTLVFLFLGLRGWRAMRLASTRTADAVAILTLSGTLGVCAYLNLKSGATIGYGFVPAGAHEARERDYFYVLGFWGWGLFAGYGALALIRARRWPAWLALTAAMVPLLGNFTANDRARGASATAARDVAVALLTSAPRDAMLFVAGDNDSYPLWYLQTVEGIRRDVTTVTMPLLPADWYAAEVARRTRLVWLASGHVEGAQWAHQELAAHIARAAREAGRPVAVSPSMSSKERALLGSNWRLTGAVYLSSAPANGSLAPPIIDSLSDVGLVRPRASDGGKSQLPDDVSASMLGLLECGRLARLPAGSSRARDSLETRCNLR
ncbi:MAG: DUF2723 domain-containing protein, partial [bacterium]